MPTIEDSPIEVVKILVLGDSGTGKTGLLATLARDYRLIIADFDMGLSILRDEKILPKDLRKKVYYKQFYDKTQIIAGQAINQANAYKDFMSALGNWSEGEEKLGSIYSWGPETVFVVDSLTFFGDRCVAYQQLLAGHLGQKLSQPDLGGAMDYQESLLEMLYNPAVRCNVVVTAHLKMQSDEIAGGIKKLFPSSLGQKLGPKVPRYFDNVVLLEKIGTGDKITRQLQTSGTHNISLKVAKPSKISAIFEPDLGKLFALLKS